MLGSNDILFVGGDQEDWTAVCIPLEQADFHVANSVDCLQALKDLNNGSYALVIFDTRQNGVKALDTCRFVHDVMHIPVLLITSPGNEQEILDGLDAGAADFLMRPIRPYELVARVRTILKRTSSPLALPGWIIQSEDLMLDLRARRLIRNGQSTLLTRMEMRLLSYLMYHLGKVVSKADLLENVWNYQPVSGDFNLVDSAIKRLRQTIEDDPKNPQYIHTVWGEGYRFGRG